MQVLVIIFYVLAILALLTVIIPLIKNDNWIFRIFDYPRFQKLLIIIVLLIFGSILFPNFSNTGYILFALLGLAVVYLLWLIVPYSVFGKKMLKRVDKKYSEESIKILVSNVLQDNHDYQKTLDLIATRDADIVFLLETDQGWCDAMQSIKSAYPNYIEIPLPNTYGLLFYSKFKITHQEINYLIDPEIPSIITDVDFYGKTIRLFGLHPTPPVPQENPKSTDRDAEILLIGKMAKSCPYPCIVFGDLNDVAWSYTTRLFLRISGLLDARKGRGMYSTFHAEHWYLRWPLDHFFVSSHFRLMDMRVEAYTGSDHFPISIELVLRKEDKEMELEATQEDKALANEKIEKAQE